MEFMILIVGGITISMFLFIFRKNFFVEIPDTQTGLVFFFNKLVENTILPPGTHFLPQKIGPIWINRVVKMPGRQLQIDIAVDKGITNDNVEVTFDALLVIQLQLTPEAHPTFDSALALSRWIQLAPGEALFTTIVNGQEVKGKLNERLTSIVNDAVTKVVNRYTSVTIISTPEVYDELITAIKKNVWKRISSWAGILLVEVSQIEVVDAINRTKMELDAKAQANVILTEAQAELEMDKRYQATFGDNAAFMRIAGRSFKGSNLNIFSDGIGGLLRTLSTVNSEPSQMEIMKPIPRRVRRGRRTR